MERRIGGGTSGKPTQITKDKEGGRTGGRGGGRGTYPQRGEVGKDYEGTQLQ